MAAPLRQYRTHSQLGGYYAIFLSGFVALVVLMLMLEQLGSAPVEIQRYLVGSPLVVYALIGQSALTYEASMFFVAGRSITSFFNGLTGAVVTLGGTGLAGITGALFFIGEDALALPLGISVGIMLCAVLIAPYVRKDGSYTPASYLARRFESRPLRVMGAVAISLAAMLLLIAEIKLGIYLGAHALGLSERTIVLGIIAVVVATLVPGGMRGLTRVASAQSVVMLLAVLVPVAVVGLLATNLPLPQITYGTVLDDVMTLEARNGILDQPRAAASLALPGPGPQAVQESFMPALGVHSPLGFLVLALGTAFGIAALPALVMRAGSGRSVFETRKAMGWTSSILVIVLLTLPAIAVFVRLTAFGELAGRPVDNLPTWLDRLAAMGLVDYDGQGAQLALDKVRFARDGILLMLPIVHGFPAAVVQMVLVGLMSAILAAAAAQALALSATWTEDIVFAWSEPGSSEQLRLNTARGLVVVAICLGGWLALRVHADPLTLFTWALAFSGASIFPLLVMSVWWKRISRWGAMAGLTAGLASVLVLMVLSVAGSIPSEAYAGGLLAGVIGVPLASMVALAVSLAAPGPDQRVRDLVRDIRVPGGETVYDREVRLARIGRRRAP